MCGGGCADSGNIAGLVELRGINSHVQTDRAHEGQGIAVLDYAGPHPVVEEHLSIHKLVFEMDVPNQRCQAVGDLGQGQVVGREQPDRTAVDQALDDRLGADASVVRVRSMEQLVEEEQEGKRTLGQVDQLPDPGDLGIEPRATGLQRILNPKCRSHGQQGESQLDERGPVRRRGPVPR